jgi:hypothetical protein
LKTKKAVFLLLVFLVITQVTSAQTDSLYLWTQAVPGETKQKSTPVPTTLEDGSIRVIEVTTPFWQYLNPVEKTKTTRLWWFAQVVGMCVLLSTRKDIL